jgi:intracellular septation protein
MSVISILSSKKFIQLVTGMVLEFGPIVVFLVSFHHFHIYRATFILMIATIVSTVVTYKMQKRLPYLALYVAFLTIIFGYMTIEYHQPKFIQMKDTLYDATSALTLIIGMMINISFLKLAFNEVIPMPNRAWMKLTYAWTFYFILNAIANEYIRRTYSLQEWFDFKSVVVFVTLIFGCAALYFVYESSEVKLK